MTRRRTTEGRGRSRKLMLTAGLIGLTATALGAAAVATFTSTTNVSQGAASGTVEFAPISTNGAGNRLSVAATDMAAGDTVQRAVTLTNTGSIDMLPGSVQLTTTATTSSLLDTGADGLTMTIDRCSVAWTESAFPYTYTCSGTTQSVLTTSPVIGANVPLANITTTAGAPNHLRVTLQLPSVADNTYQNQSSVIGYVFAGTQRNATAR